MANQAAKISSGITQTQFNSYVGEVGRLFYNLSTGELRISDGQTPKGLPVYVAVSSANIGNLLITNTTISTLTANANINLSTNGLGTVNVTGAFYVTSPQGNLLLQMQADNTTTFYVPNQNSTQSAIEIVGSTDGVANPILTTGVMLNITGQPSQPSRVYNDAQGGYGLIALRRVNGTTSSPTAVLLGDDVGRYGGSAYDGNSIPVTGIANMRITAAENQTPTAHGSNISFWTTSIGSIVLQQRLSIDSNGLKVVTGNITGNLIGNVTGTATTATNLSAASSILAGQVNIPAQTIPKNTASVDVTVTVTGLTTSHKVIVTPAADLNAGIFVTAGYPTTANTLGIQLQNTGGAITTSAFNLTYWAWI